MSKRIRDLSNSSTPTQTAFPFGQRSFGKSSETPSTPGENLHSSSSSPATISDLSSRRADLERERKRRYEINRAEIATWTPVPCDVVTYTVSYNVSVVTTATGDLLDKQDQRIEDIMRLHYPDAQVVRTGLEAVTTYNAAYGVEVSSDT